MASRFRMGPEIGRGALGRVVELIELETGREYAGKLLHDSYRSDPRATERFGREVAFLRDLDHPNVVGVRELARIDDHDVLVMERVRGPSLAELIAREAPLPEARMVPIARGIAAGLAAAHHRGIVHRDLKPANVLLDASGEPKLVDFGLARATSLLGVDRAALAIVGTPDYLAPESIDPLAVDPRSDLYALGCILYEMTSGRPPFSGATAFALLEAHRRQPLPPLEPDPTRSPRLVALIAELLAKSPADRPQSAGAVLDAIEELGSPRALAVRPPAELTPACARCGAPLVASVALCFGCGTALPVADDGPITLFVTGPGGVADKLDTQLRQHLVDWLRGTPTLGLDPAPLEKRVPRLPFVLASNLSEASARAIADGLAPLGLQCELRRGGSMSLPAMRRKARALSGRAAAIIMMSAGGLQFTLFPTAAIAPVLGLLGAAAFGIGWSRAVQRTTSRGARPPGHGPALSKVLAAVAVAVPQIEAARHRDALRGVAHRVLRLREALGGASARDEELAGVLAGATHVALRLDRLERELLASDLRDIDSDTRAKLDERDRLAGRVLELTARLDGLRIHAAAAGAGAAADELGPRLDELRAEVEALEEIEALT